MGAEAERGIFDVLPARASGEDREFIRLECLRLAASTVPAPHMPSDAARDVIRIAREFETYVYGANPGALNLADTE